MRSWMRRPAAQAEETDGVSFAPQELAGLFTAPRWLRDLGISAWLAVGVTLAVVGAVWVMALTHTIVTPVITATVVAAVASPLLRKLARHMPRGLAAALLLVVVLVIAVGVVAIVL